MSILIKGMEMPKSCRKCCLCDFNKEGYYCVKLEKMLDRWHVRTQRDPNCPLIEIPTAHGNLIDREALIDTLGASDRDIYCKCVIEEDAPTIIGAEGIEE